MVFGGPDQIVEQIKTKALDAGVDGVILTPITNLNGYRPGGITAAAEKSSRWSQFKPAATW